MPAKAALLYIGSKLQHEIYVADMLFYTARGFITEPESLPRYIELIVPKTATVTHDYSVSDVIDIFRGRR